MKRIYNKIGALPVALYGTRRTDGHRLAGRKAEGRKKIGEARKDKRRGKKKKTGKESKKERCTSTREEGKEGGRRKEEKKGGKRKRKKKTTEGNREAVVAEFCSRTTVVGGAVHIRGKLYPGYCSLAVSVLR